jgi:hypothetical protein
MLELYDAHEHSTAMWKAGSVGASTKLGPVGEPEELLDAIQDPWSPTTRSVSEHAPVWARPGAGL